MNENAPLLFQANVIAMKATAYKLCEYKIIESDTGDLTWEAHSGFATLQEGGCIKKGTVLFIGPKKSDCHGFLKGDFIDRLKQFPEWSKTKYYFKGLAVYHCRTCKRVTRKEMLLWMFDQGVDEGDRRYSEKSKGRSNNVPTQRTTGDAAFRLQKYKIIKKANGHIVWKAPSGRQTASGGPCIILEDILFIGPGTDEQSTIMERQFFADLQQLPEWDQTKYYCPKPSLYDCKTGERVTKDRATRPAKGKEPKTHDHRKGYKDNIKFRLQKRYPWQTSTALFTRWVGKWLTYAAALALLTITLLLACLIRCWKVIRAKWPLSPVLKYRP